MAPWEAIVLVVVAALATPFVLYLTAKLVTYGILAGRDRFYRDNPQPPTPSE
jgi:hypothetical protein